MSKFVRLCGRIVGILILLTLVSGIGQAGEGWKGPVDITSRRVLVGKVAGLYPCLEPPPSLHDITAFHYFKDKANSIIDPDLLARNRLAVRPLEDYARSVQGIAEAYLRSAPVDSAIAQCALDWLWEWANDDALLGEMSSRQAVYQREWTTIALALPFLTVRDNPSLDPARRARVVSWFHDLGDAIRRAHDQGGAIDTLNNHMNWAAAAVMTTAIIAHDDVGLNWALTRYRMALQQIQPEGSLPLEMARGSRARHYHLFALSPLVLMAEIGARNGWDLYDQENRALHRLVNRVIEGLADASWFEQRAGAPQEWPVRFSGSYLAWAEIYYARYRDPRLLVWLQRHRPARSTLLGGDATLYYGVMPLPPLSSVHPLLP